MILVIALTMGGPPPIIFDLGSLSVGDFLPNFPECSLFRE